MCSCGRKRRALNAPRLRGSADRCGPVHFILEGGEVRLVWTVASSVMDGCVKASVRQQLTAPSRRGSQADGGAHRLNARFSSTKHLFSSAGLKKKPDGCAGSHSSCRLDPGSFTCLPAGTLTHVSPVEAASA